MYGWLKYMSRIMNVDLRLDKLNIEFVKAYLWRRWTAFGALERFVEGPEMQSRRTGMLTFFQKK